MEYTLSLICLATGLLVPTTIAASSRECTSPAAMKFMPLLNYAPAEAYCSKHYPDILRVSSTTTCDPNALQQPQRRQSSHGHGFGDPYTGIGMPRPEAADPEQVLALLLQSDDPSAISSFCSCLAEQDPPPTLVNCTAGQFCDTSGHCQLQRDCSNPSRCDANSLCGRGPLGDNLFCHHDTDRGDVGYCMNDGPPGRSCPAPEQYDDCSSNAECGELRVCIYSCCREEPFCVDVSEYRYEAYSMLAAVK